MSDEAAGGLESRPGKARPGGATPHRPPTLRVRGGPTLEGGPHLDLAAQIPPRKPLQAVSVTAGIDLATRMPFREKTAEGHCPERPAPRRPCPSAGYQVEAVELQKSFRKGPAEVAVLKGVSLGVRRGQILAIVGQSGSGKSTLLHLLGTLDAPDQGEIYFNGLRIDRLPASQRDRLRNRHFGMIFQFYHLLPELTALENVLAPLMIAEGLWGFWLHHRRHRRLALGLLEKVGLSHRRKHKPRELSGGEMQRAAIARALVAGPDLLLADEPTGNLDQATGREILDLLHSLNREQNLTIVMVTHDPLIAQQADRVVRLVDGRIVEA
jgi:lipoprotein-releasing system ATP-binding protein